MEYILTWITFLGGIAAGYILGHWFPAKPLANFDLQNVTVADYECNVCGKKWSFRYRDGCHGTADVERDYALVKNHTDNCLKRAEEEA
jgi:hypothetical protein